MKIVNETWGVFMSSWMLLEGTYSININSKKVILQTVLKAHKNINCLETKDSQHA